MNTLFGPAGTPTNRVSTLPDNGPHNDYGRDVDADEFDTYMKATAKRRAEGWTDTIEEQQANKTNEKERTN